jgi:hypothetical protein
MEFYQLQIKITFSGEGSTDLRVDRSTKLFYLIHSFYWVVNWNKIMYLQ